MGGLTFSRVVGVSSQLGQSGLVSTPNIHDSWGYISPAPPWQSLPTYTVYADITRDSRKMLLKLSRKGDNISKLLKPYVGSQVTIYVPQLGVAWTSTLSYNKHWGYIYVRIPSKLRKLFEPMWLAGYPIPIVVSIPPISITQDNLKPAQG